MTLVLGGIRSGKSQYAEQIAAGFGEKILYVATAEVWPGAGSMEYRVRKHQERRPKSWLTLECPRHVASAVGESGLLDQVDGVILECVTLLASNTLYAQKDPTDYEPFQEALIEEIEALKKLIRQSPCHGCLFLLKPAWASASQMRKRATTATGWALPTNSLPKARMKSTSWWRDCP